MSKDNDWLAVLRSAYIKDVEPVPKGWKTAKEVEREIGKSCSQTRANLALLISSGLAEKKLFRTMTGAGVRPVPYYRIKKG